MADRISFTSLMASSVHDIKNVLGTVLESFGHISENEANLSSQSKDELQRNSSLIAHVNTQLMQLLVFYKQEQEQYKLNSHEHEIDSFCNMQKAFISSLIPNGKIEVDIDALDDVWFFDEVLIASAVRNALMNSLKFAKSKIIIRAEFENKMLKITVADDGDGYPEDMLGIVDLSKSAADFSTGSTGLGLYFSEMVANLHKVKDKHGYVELSRDLLLGGAAFTIYVP